MLQKPLLSDSSIAERIQAEYGLSVAHITFLPLGADLNTAVYRIDAEGNDRESNDTEDESAYFLKLRSGTFDPASVMYPKLLSEHGLAQIIPPLLTQAGELWGQVDAFKMILAPFVNGQNGYEVRLTDEHWREFGATLKAMHELTVPSTISSHVAVEDYSPRWRESVRHSLRCVDGTTVDRTIVNEPVAQETTAFLQSKNNDILSLVDRAESLASVLKAQPQELIVCHADLHAGNVFITDDNRFYLVDWDTLKLASKERDLMYVGGALMANHRSPEEEMALFYEGYGPAQIDSDAVAYYRAERIIEDIAIYAEQLLFSEEGGADRPFSLQALKSNFLPRHTIEMAYKVN